MLYKHKYIIVSTIYVTDNKYIFRSQRIVCFRCKKYIILARSLHSLAVIYKFTIHIICNTNRSILLYWQNMWLIEQDIEIFGSIAPLARNNLWKFLLRLYHGCYKQKHMWYQIICDIPKKIPLSWLWLITANKHNYKN